MIKATSVALLLTVGSIYPCSIGILRAPLWKKNPRSNVALFRFIEDGRIGFINRDGQIAIPAIYDNKSWVEDDFGDGLLRVEENEKVSYVDDKGVVRLKVSYEMQLGSFAEGLVEYYVSEHRLYGYLDQSGEPVIQAQFGEARPFSEGLAAVRKEARDSGLGRAGYIDKTGRWAIGAKFASGGPFHDGLAVVVQDGQCRFGIGRPQAAPAVATRDSCGDNSDIKERCRYGVISKDAKYVVAPKFDFIRDYSEGLAAFKTGDKWGYLDRTGRTAIGASFDAAMPFSEGMATVRADDKWGYVSRSGDMVVPPQFDDAGDFSDDRAPVRMGSKWGFIDHTGAMVIPLQFLEATAFAKGLAHVRPGKNELGWIRPDGTIVFRYVDRRRL